MSSAPEAKGNIATSIAELLRHLSDRTKRQRTDSSVDSPRATVLLASGEWVSGRVLAVSDTGETTLIATGGHNFTLVRLDQISAATVTADPDVAELFGERTTPIRTPTKLELARRLEALSAGLAERLGSRPVVCVRWVDFPRTPKAMGELGAAITSISATLRGLADDDLGREALQPIEVVELVRGDPGENNSAKLDGSTLRLVARVQGDRISPPDSAVIEAVL